jgi:nifR3 family TIM-barrel protein
MAYNILFRLFCQRGALPDEGGIWYSTGMERPALREAAQSASAKNPCGLYRAVTVGTLELPGNLFLAPVAGWSDAAFRGVCARMGAHFTYTELVSAASLVYSGGRYNVLLENAAEKPPYAIQLFGADAEIMAAAVETLPPYKPHAIDLNAGCPVPKVTKTGAGSALMRDSGLLERVIYALRRASERCLGGAPVTVKMRAGWDSTSINAQECARRAEGAGAAAVCVHPRTRAQGYGGQADWGIIAGVKRALTIPVFGSGDLNTPEDAAHMLRETGCDGVMFARGALGNPFIFRQTRAFLETGSYAPAGDAEKIAVAFGQLRELAALTNEKHACLEMRKVFCAYTKGIHGSAALRARLTLACFLTDYHALLAEYTAKADAGMSISQ